MLDESLLDDPEGLARVDTRELLRGAAQSGARVRTGIRYATDAGLGALQPEGRPRAVLVAGPGPVISSAAELLGALSNGAAWVTALQPTGALPAPGALRWSLPGWAGPLDLLLIATPDGSEPGLTPLVEQAYRRGCTVVAVTPPGAPLAGVVGDTRGLAVPMAPAAHESYDVPQLSTRDGGRGAGSQEPDTAWTLLPDELPVPSAGPGTLWAVLTPLLMLGDRLGLFPADHVALEAAAVRLDDVAERCGPAVATYSSPAKILATELAETFPVLWSDGALADVAGRHCAELLTALSGCPVLAAGLPEALTRHAALLRGPFGKSTDEADFFRDRVDEPQDRQLRVLLMREQAPGTDTDSAAVAARELLEAQNTPLSELEPAADSGPLETAAELIATTEFAAAYLALAGSSTPWR